MLELTVRFLIIGALAFDGGQAALPLVERLAVADTGWLTPAQFATGVGLSYATPGPVLILAAFIGYHVAAVPGAMAATAAVFAVPVVLAGFASTRCAAQGCRLVPGVWTVRCCGGDRAAWRHLGRPRTPPNRCSSGIIVGGGGHFRGRAARRTSHCSDQRSDAAWCMFVPTVEPGTRPRGGERSVAADHGRDT